MTCPDCRSEMEAVDEGMMRCPACRLQLNRSEVEMIEAERAAKARDNADDPEMSGIPCPLCSEPMCRHEEDEEGPERFHCHGCKVAMPVEVIEDPDYDAQLVKGMMERMAQVTLGLPLGASVEQPHPLKVPQYVYAACGYRVVTGEWPEGFLAHNALFDSLSVLHRIEAELQEGVELLEQARVRLERLVRLENEVVDLLWMGTDEEVERGDLQRGYRQLALLLGKGES